MGLDREGRKDSRRQERRIPGIRKEYVFLGKGIMKWGWITASNETQPVSGPFGSYKSVMSVRTKP